MIVIFFWHSFKISKNKTTFCNPQLPFWDSWCYQLYCQPSGGGHKVFGTFAYTLKMHQTLHKYVKFNRVHYILAYRKTLKNCDNFSVILSPFQRIFFGIFIKSIILFLLKSILLIDNKRIIDFGFLRKRSCSFLDAKKLNQYFVYVLFSKKDLFAKRYRRLLIFIWLMDYKDNRILYFFYYFWLIPRFFDILVSFQIFYIQLDFFSRNNIIKKMKVLLIWI